MTALQTARTIRIEPASPAHGEVVIAVDALGDRVDAARLEVRQGIRLIEGLVRGRSWEDVPQLVSRICGRCAVAHSLTASKAFERAFGVAPGPTAERLRDLLWRGQSIATHGLDLARVSGRSPRSGSAGAAAPRLVRLGTLIRAGIGGRPIHPVTPVPGGFKHIPTEKTLDTLRSDLVAARPNVEAVLDLARALPRGDAAEGEVDGVWLALRQDEDRRYDHGDQLVIVDSYERRTIPAEALPKIAPERAVPHSHVRHSRIDGRLINVGPLARLMINRDRLGRAGQALMDALDLGATAATAPSFDPQAQHRARALELALDVNRALETVESLLAGGRGGEKPAPIRPRAGIAAVATEAPGGTLLHRYQLDGDGRVTAAAIMAPGALAAAGIDAHLHAAARRQGAGDEAALAARLEAIVDAFAACPWCAVH